MTRLKLIYGSDTGNTEHVIDSLVINMLSKYDLETKRVEELESDDWNTHDFYILSIPTWYDGELQSDWEDYFEEFKKINFEGKKIAIFGLGDQIGYEEWFCDGVGILAEVVESNGGTIIGKVSRDDSYEFETEPKILIDQDTFWGLPLDEDNQDELTEERLKNWFRELETEWK